jgi:hypothetical protein
MSDTFQKSLKAWGIRHRLSSACNPHSNCRAELAVKVGKKLLRDNTVHGGSLDTDKFMRAVLQYRNTPMQYCRRSPAQMVFGRQMRDFIPSLTYKYEPAKDWPSHRSTGRGPWPTRGRWTTRGGATGPKPSMSLRLGRWWPSKIKQAQTPPSGTRRASSSRTSPIAM